MMQSSCLKIWDGMEENKEKAQVEIVHVCVCVCVFKTHTSKTTSCTPGAAEGEGAGELGGKPRKVQGRLTAVSLGIALPEELRLLSARVLLERGDERERAASPDGRDGDFDENRRESLNASVPFPSPHRPIVPTHTRDS